LSNIFLIFLLEAYGVGGEALCFIMGSFPEMKSYSHCAPHPCLQGRVYGALAGQIRPLAPKNKGLIQLDYPFFIIKKTPSDFSKLIIEGDPRASFL
jgi:hypothetical protein